MRLYPSAPLLGRRAVEEDQILGYRIPAGADVVVAPWVVHRHPDFWDQPHRFDPHRFVPEREKARHRYAWFPFGGGPRGCIGQHFSDARVGARPRDTGPRVRLRRVAGRAAQHQPHHASPD